MHCLLINPWIYDFAAFDLWQKPLGLLYMGAVMREHGWTIDLLDCLDRFDPELISLESPYNKKFYTGKYYKRIIPKPDNLSFVPRKYGCYGMPEELVKKRLNAMKKPDIVFLTSGMTYWYPALKDIVLIIKEYFPITPIILGGVYATLAPENARKTSPVDDVITGEAENRLNEIIPKQLWDGIHFKEYESLDDIPYPAFDLYHTLHFLPLLTTRGCPFRCSFCASYRLSGTFRKRSPKSVIDELIYSIKKYNIQDVVFYDDALLTDKDEHIKVILDTVAVKGLNVRFHTPNGLQVNAFDDDIAKQMVSVGFATIRLGLESIAEEKIKDISQKASPEKFIAVVESFKRAGLSSNRIEAYILMGLPGQNIFEVIDTLFFAAQQGVIVRLSSFSPIPGTKDWSRLIESGHILPDIDLTETNNTVFIHRFPEYSFEVVNKVKEIVNSLNNCNKNGTPLPNKKDAYKEIWEIYRKQGMTSFLYSEIDKYEVVFN